MEPLLPDDDPDLALARRLAAGEAPGPTDAAWLRAAEAYRRETQATPSEARSERLWSGIAVETRPAARIHRLPTWTRWAAAAVLLMGVALVARFLDTPDPLFVVAPPGAVPQTVALADGSEVTLRPGSSLRQVGEDRYRLQGEGFFAVASSPSRTFRVEAGAATVEVLGTRFGVAALGDSVAVFLEEGRVRFAAADRAVTLAAGQASHLAGGVPTSPAAVEADEALGWTAGTLVFRGAPLARVARELEMQYAVRLVVPATAAAEPVTGTLVLGEAAETIGRLGRVVGGRFEQTDDRTYRLVVE